MPLPSSDLRSWGPPCTRISCAAAVPTRAPPAARPRMPPLFPCSRSTRQDAAAFNQPLSWDTSSVTTMINMFRVCAPRVPLPAQPPQLGFLPAHAACAAATAPRSSRRPAPHAAALFPPTHASLSTRQDAQAFNQPLSWNTSSATTMDGMFYVRSARALPAQPPQLGSSLRTLLAPPPPHAPLPSPGPTCRPSSLAPVRRGSTRRRSTSR